MQPKVPQAAVKCMRGQLVHARPQAPLIYCINLITMCIVLLKRNIDKHSMKAYTNQASDRNG